MKKQYREDLELLTKAYEVRRNELKNSLLEYSVKIFDDDGMEISQSSRRGSKSRTVSQEKNSGYKA